MLDLDWNENIWIWDHLDVDKTKKGMKTKTNNNEIKRY